MKTSRLVLAPAVAVALTGLAGAPAYAATESTASVPQQPLCAQDEEQSSNDSESDSSVPDESDPQATLAQAQVTRDDIANQKKGIGFSGTGFTPDEKATVTVVGTDGTEYSPKTKLTVDEKGQVSGTYFFSVTDGAKVPVGKYSLYLTDLKSEKKSSKVTFEVVSKDSDVDDPGSNDNPGDKNDNCDSATAPTDNGDDESQSPSPSESETGQPTESNTPSPTDTDDKSDDKSDDDQVKGVNPGPAKKPTDEPTTEAPKSEDPTTKAPKADEPTTDAPSTEAPKPTETDDSEDSDDEKSDETKDSEDEKTEEPTTEAPKTDDAEKSEDESSEDEDSEDKASESTGSASPGSEEKKAPAAAKQSLFIDPTEISSEDFLDEGIKLGVSGAQPGEKITITVEHAQGKVDRYTMTKEADSEGKATFGVQAKVKAVLGTYNVRAQAESFDEPQGGSFTVLTNGTAVDEGGSGSGSGSDSSGSDLPRTGAEMTGLALGVGLLAVGAAAVIITRRRMNATDDPAEF